MARDYAKEYRDYHGKPEQIANRAQRNAAHSAAEKRAGHAIHDDVHHVKPIRKGGTNAAGNTRVTDPAANKGWRKGKTGYD